MEQLEAMSILELQDVARNIELEISDKDKRTLIYDIINKQAEDYSTATVQPKLRRSRIHENTIADKIYTSSVLGKGKTVKAAANLSESGKKKRGRPSKAEIAAREMQAVIDFNKQEEGLTDVVQEETHPPTLLPATHIEDEDIPSFISDQLATSITEETVEKLIGDHEVLEDTCEEVVVNSIKSEAEKIEGKAIYDTDFVIIQDIPRWQESCVEVYKESDNEVERSKFRRYKDDPFLMKNIALSEERQESMHSCNTLSLQPFTPLPTLSFSGVLELQNDGTGFLRSAEYNYLPSPDDVFLTVHQVRQYSLKVGDVVDCTVRVPRENEKHFILVEIEKINGLEPSIVRDRIAFEHLTPLFPEEKFRLCTGSGDSLSCRIVDLFTPIGKGQRALIVAQPKTGKTMLMKDIANAIAQNHPNTYLIMLLIDERPEEVTDMARTVNAEVVASTFDEPAAHHVKIAGLVLEKAKRMVECGHDVVIFLDSITRLARAYNTVAPTSGKVLTGGVDANALQKPKRFFGAARNIEGVGSLTIIATALIDTGSKMDEVIFEEFKGTGNMELQLERSLANKRIFPAINLVASSTRRDDLLMEAQAVNRMHILRNIIADMHPIEALTEVRRRMDFTRTNEEFLVSMNS